jgi:hypothetical protein
MNLVTGEDNVGRIKIKHTPINGVYFVLNQKDTFAVSGPDN